MELIRNCIRSHVITNINRTNNIGQFDHTLSLFILEASAKFRNQRNSNSNIFSLKVSTYKIGVQNYMV